MMHAIGYTQRNSVCIGAAEHGFSVHIMPFCEAGNVYQNKFEKSSRFGNQPGMHCMMLAMLAYTL